MGRLTHLIFDVDGVLLDWSRGFMKFMENEGYPPRSHVHRRWDMTCSWPKLSPVELGKLIKEFHHSLGYAHLDPIPGAFDAVKALKRRLGAKVVAVTACGLDVHSLINRLQPLQPLGGVIDAVHAVDVHASKEDMFRQFPAATSIVFEDRPENAAVALGLGVRVVLLDQPYNQGFTGAHRAYGWGEIVEHLTEGMFDVVAA